MDPSSNPSSIEEMQERTRSLIEALRENIFVARELREVAQVLRDENADYREFLSEKRVNALCRYEEWLEQKGKRAGLLSKLLL
jgi:hypothetical protein